MDDTLLLRYSRQIMLPDIDLEGQETLCQSRILIIGMGGLGSPAVMYLAAAGIGQLTLVDFDTVDLSNLQRQIIHTTADLGLNKAESACHSALAINPSIIINRLKQKLNKQELYKQVKKHDVVLDCSDNFTTRFAINEACVKTGTPLVSGAAIRMEGQVSVFQPQLPESPCYRCLYSDKGDDLDMTCSANGVFSPVVGIIGSVQATEAMKVLLGLPTLTGRLLLLDAKYMEWRSMRLKKDPACPVCAQD